MNLVATTANTRTAIKETLRPEPVSEHHRTPGWSPGTRGPWVPEGRTQGPRVWWGLWGGERWGGVGWGGVGGPGILRSLGPSRDTCDSMSQEFLRF